MGDCLTLLLNVLIWRLVMILCSPAGVLVEMRLMLSHTRLVLMNCWLVLEYDDDTSVAVHCGLLLLGFGDGT